MNKGLLYGAGILITTLLIGTWTIGVFPSTLLGTLLCGLVAGYTSMKDLEDTTIKVMFISVLTGFLFWPSLPPMVGVMFIACLFGGGGAVIGHRFNPSVSSVPQPVL